MPAACSRPPHNMNFGHTSGQLQWVLVSHGKCTTLGVVWMSSFLLERTFLQSKPRKQGHGSWFWVYMGFTSYLRGRRKERKHLWWNICWGQKLNISASFDAHSSCTWCFSCLWPMAVLNSSKIVSSAAHQEHSNSRGVTFVTDLGLDPASGGLSCPGSVTSWLCGLSHTKQLLVFKIRIIILLS